LGQHIEVPPLSAAKRRCRLIYLVLTGALRTRVQVGNGCAVTGKTEVVMSSDCHVLSHRGGDELGHVVLLFLDRFWVGKGWLEWKRLVLSDAPKTRRCLGENEKNEIMQDKVVRARVERYRAIKREVALERERLVDWEFATGEDLPALTGRQLLALWAWRYDHGIRGAFGWIEPWY
jgi:hypothetical protein